MPFFKKKKETGKIAKQKKKGKKIENKTIKKRKRVGFRKKPELKEEVPPNIEKEEEMQDVLPEIEEPELPEEPNEITKTPNKKKKQIIKTNMEGMPVFLEDTGEKLGMVYDSIYNKEKNIVGYKIKDEKSDTILSFSIDQFDYSKEGLIFVPGWYTNALKIIERLEFKDKISPELTALLSEDNVTNEELYEIFVKHDDEMVHYIDDAKTLRTMLNKRLRVLEKERLTMKDNLMNLTEKRLIRDIDRRKFSEDVMEHRRKANILDININKCKELIIRLDKTSFGIIGKKSSLYGTETKPEYNLYHKILDRDTIETTREKHETGKGKGEYKEKYLNLKAEFERLHEDYQELKTAVDKLVTKNEL